MVLNQDRIRQALLDQQPLTSAIATHRRAIKDVIKLSMRWIT